MHSNSLALASLLLDKAADELSRNGCNDFTLPNTPENVELLNDMEQDNVGPGREPEKVHVFDAHRSELYTSDWWLAKYLSQQLKKEIDVAKSSKKNPTPEHDAEPVPDDEGYVSLDAELEAAQEKLRICEAEMRLTQAKLEAAIVETEDLQRRNREALDTALAMERRIDALSATLRLWLRDYPNQILREKRRLPDDGSVLQRTVHLILNEDGTLRGVK